MLNAASQMVGSQES